MRELTLGYSPCPNDTFIFYALVHGLIDTGGLAFREELHDVEGLNLKAGEAALDVTKLSYGAFAALREEYCLLRSGGAMGFGCGPLMVSKEELRMEDLKGKTIAVPGELTTAYLLLRLYDPALALNTVAMRFDEIMGAVAGGRADAGLIIHESRFTYPGYGLKNVLDLGKWWESETGLPIPLGAIAARRALGKGLISKADSLIKESALYAMRNGKEPLAYIKCHSQELDEGVIEAHIGLYVNEFSIDMGDRGERAVEELMRRAEDAGLIKRSSSPLFIS